MKFQKLKVKNKSQIRNPKKIIILFILHFQFTFLKTIMFLAEIAKHN